MLFLAWQRGTESHVPTTLTAPTCHGLFLGMPCNSSGFPVASCLKRSSAAGGLLPSFERRARLTSSLRSSFGCVPLYGWAQGYGASYRCRRTTRETDLAPRQEKIGTRLRFRSD